MQQPLLHHSKSKPVQISDHPCILLSAMEDDSSVAKDKSDDAKNAVAGAVARDDDDDDDGTTCPICFDPWTSSGEHRVCYEH